MGTNASGSSTSARATVIAVIAVIAASATLGNTARADGPATAGGSGTADRPGTSFGPAPAGGPAPTVGGVWTWTDASGRLQFGENPSAEPGLRAAPVEASPPAREPVPRPAAGVGDRDGATRPGAARF